MQNKPTLKPLPLKHKAVRFYSVRSDSDQDNGAHLDDDHHLEEHDGQDLDDQSHDTQETSTMFIFRTPAIS